MAMPTKIRAEWIWKKSLLYNNNSFLFVRREFNIDAGLSEADIWITAHSAYQLFVNGIFVGFGPTPSGGWIDYADRYDVSDYLNLGINVISILVHFDRPQQVSRTSHPGVWCQLDIDQRPKVWTNQTWMVNASDCYEQSRSRRFPAFDFNEAVDLSSYPWGWMEALNDESISGWRDVDFVASPASLGIEIKESPLKAKKLDTVRNIAPVYRGKFELDSSKTVSYATFKECFQPTLRSTYAAKTFIFCDEAKDIKVTVISDDPYKFFCNSDLVCHKSPVNNYSLENNPLIHHATIKLKYGWNSLLFVQTTHENSMGFFVVFDDPNVELRHDTLEEAEHAWNLVGPLKMPLSLAGPSINFERLHKVLFKPSKENIADIASYLNLCKFEKYEESDSLNGKIFLKEGEYVTLALDSLRYGFPCFDCGGKEGDILDYTFGMQIDENGAVLMQGRNKSSHTTIMKNLRSPWLKFSPVLCKYMMVSVRKSARNVNVKFNEFFEYMLPTENSTIFSCSDDNINTIWRAGKNTFKHSAVHMPLNTLRPNQHLYMIDAYIQSLNAATIFGDYSYSEAYLRKFAEVQFENGNVPVISPESGYKNQFDHLFIFPVWLSYHYRANPNPQLVRDMVPHLMMIFDFFETIRAKHDTLLPVLDQNIWTFADVSDDTGTISFLTNALYCRFLLSCRELYQTVGLKASAHHYWNIAVDISLKLKKVAYSKEKHLFCDYIINGKPDNEYSFIPNVMGLYSGIHSSNEFKNVMDNFFDASTPYDQLPKETKNPYFNFIFLEILFALQEKDWAFNYLKDFWLERLNKDLLVWENDIVNYSEQNMPDDLHSGGSISPNFFLVRELAGVRLAEANYSAFYFNPGFEILDWAKLIIPTDNGKLHVEWKKLPDSGLEITIDSDFPVRVVPELTEEMLADSIFQLGANVTLLDPSSAP